MVLWKEKQVQVAKEELRIRESMSKYGGSATTVKRSQLATQDKSRAGARSAGSVDEGGAIHLGHVVGAVHMRDVWTAAAEILITHVSVQ